MTTALFWDFDGTLILPNTSFLCALEHSLAESGYMLPTDTIRAHLDAVCSWKMPEIEYPDSVGQAWWQTLFECNRTFFSQHNIPEQMHDAINREFKNRILDHTQYTLYDDAKAVLSWAMGAGYKNYIISNNFPELYDIAESLGIGRYIDGCYLSSNIGYDKPRAEIFRFSLSESGAQINYMIGDNPIADIQGAGAVGMKTILVHCEGHYAADYICRELSEIPHILMHGCKCR